MKFSKCDEYPISVLVDPARGCLSGAWAPITPFGTRFLSRTQSLPFLSLKIEHHEKVAAHIRRTVFPPKGFLSISCSVELTSCNFGYSQTASPANVSSGSLRLSVVPMARSPKCWS
jgi:hypothetical protein